VRWTERRRRTARSYRPRSQTLLRKWSRCRGASSAPDAQALAQGTGVCSRFARKHLPDDRRRLLLLCNGCARLGWSSRAPRQEKRFSSKRERFSARATPLLSLTSRSASDDVRGAHDEISSLWPLLVRRLEPEAADASRSRFGAVAGDARQIKGPRILRAPADRHSGRRRRWCRLELGGAERVAEPPSISLAIPDNCG